MKCHEARRRLDVFHDGELSVSENLKVLEHLNLCASCGGVYEGEKAMRAALKDQLGAERAPEGLGDRIRLRLDPAPPLPRWRWSAAAAAVLVGIMTAALLLTPTPNDPGLIAAEASTRHEAHRDGYCGSRHDDERCVCADCCDNPSAAAATFFEDRGVKDMCLHDLKKLGYELKGVSTFKRRGRLICWTVQKDAEGRTVSHALMHGPVDLSGGEPVVLDEGRAVLFQPRGDTGMT